MSDKQGELDLNVLLYRFGRLEGLCNELEHLIKQPKYATAECQTILIKLRDELELVDILIEIDKLWAAIKKFKITARELYILSFAGREKLLEKAFKNDKRSIAELIGKVRTSISLWKTRITGEYKLKATPIIEADKSKQFFKNNTVFEHILLGRVEIKYLTLADAEKIEHFLQESNTRHFTVLVVHNQLVQPQLSLSKIEAWADNVLIEICSKLLGNEPSIKKYFHRHTSCSFFEDFYNTFTESFKEQRQRSEVIQKQLQEKYGGLVKQMASMLDTTGVEIAMKALSAYDFRYLSESIQAIQNMSRFTKLPLSLPMVRPVWLDTPFIKSVSYPVEDTIGEVSQETVEVLLNGIDPELERKRQGAWQTFYSTSQDRISQAIYSMREVLRLLLDILAPEKEIPKAPWYNKPKKGAALVTRKMRVRYALGGVKHEVSESTLDLIVSLADTVEKTYSKLSAETHCQNEVTDTKTEAYLKSCEAVILLLLVHRSA
jgi:hypothetical protein